MKSTELKPTTSSNKNSQKENIGKPFFQKDSEGSFFSKGNFWGDGNFLQSSTSQVQMKTNENEKVAGFGDMELQSKINSNDCGCISITRNELSMFSKKEQAKSHDDKKVLDACQSKMSGTYMMMYVSDSGYIDGSIGSYWFVIRRGVRLVDPLSPTPPQPNYFPSNKGTWIFRNNNWIWVE